MRASTDKGKLTWYNVGNYIWLSSLSVGASLGSSVFPHWWPFLFLWYQLYYIINIGQSQYQDYRRSGRAIICAEYQIYRTFAYTPGIGNEGGMCWECSLLSVSTPLRSGKDNSTNGINNFFLESVAFSSIISGTISLRMLIYRAFAPGLPWVGHAFYTAK